MLKTLLMGFSQGLSMTSNRIIMALTIRCQFFSEDR